MIIISGKNRKIEHMLKEYRQKVDKIGQNQELRDRQTYEKPSVTRRKKLILAKYKNKSGNL